VREGRGRREDEAGRRGKTRKGNGKGRGATGGFGGGRGGRRKRTGVGGNKGGGCRRRKRRGTGGGEGRDKEEEHGVGNATMGGSGEGKERSRCVMREGGREEVDEEGWRYGNGVRGDARKGEGRMGE